MTLNNLGESRAIMIRCTFQGLQRQNHWPTIKVLFIDKRHGATARDIWASGWPSKGITTSAADNHRRRSHWWQSSWPQYCRIWKWVTTASRLSTRWERRGARWKDSLYAIAVSASLCAHVDELHQGYCTGWAGTGRSSSGWHRWQGRSSWPPEWKTDIDLYNNCHIETRSLTTVPRLRRSNIAWST